MMAAASSNKNNSAKTMTSPWPEAESDAITFLLDVRDSFESELLREWVEANRPTTAEAPAYSFIDLPKGRATDWLDALAAHGGAVWLEPLRIAWLPAERSYGRISLRDLFYGRVTLPGMLRRGWLAKFQPDRLA